ncbi:MAG: SDR family oxidoreductase [Nitrospirae bacterium]|nr:SDR family oxidoreductase [Nitrospirota bacterium]
MRFQDQIVIITGGTGGLGQAVTRAFLTEGARTVVTYQVDAEIEALLPVIGDLRDRNLLMKTDVTDEASVRKLVDQVVSLWGRIDVLVNLVGGFAPGTVADSPWETWERMLALNLRSAVLCSREVLSQMQSQRRGVIINTASLAAYRGGAGIAAYAVAKEAVRKFSEILAEEVRAQGIRVNAILPGTIDTPANRQAMPEADPNDWVPPEEIASAILFLASEDARAVKGASLPVFRKA